MIRKLVSLLLMFVLLLHSAVLCVSATESTDSSNIIRFDDGSYIEILIEESFTRASSTKTGYKLYRYRDASDNIEWEADLTATFTYNGTTSVCNSADCTVTIYDSRWYVITNNTYRSSGTATTQLVMGEKFWGITISKPEYVITLTCDKDGNLS